MKVLVAPDKFKGSLTAEIVCQAVAEGIRASDSSIEITCVPMADGGEGTARILTTLTKGITRNVIVNDPLGRKITAEFGLSPDGNDAFLEMASASGLHLLSQEERNPAITSTVGTGQLIRAALSENVRRIIMGIGGSATNDAGTGMASALGVRFFAKDGRALSPSGKILKDIFAIDFSGIDPRLSDTQFIVLCDVSNPLVGHNGAARVYAAQKGADANMIDSLEEGMTHFEDLVQREFRVDINFPGAGAAGGLGAGAHFFLNARIHSGSEFLQHYTALESLVLDSDIVITGEGKVDHQTLSGKVVSAIGALCRKHSKPLWLIAGKNMLTAGEQQQIGFERMIALVNSGIPEESAVSDAFRHIKALIKKEFDRYLLPGERP